MLTRGVVVNKKIYYYIGVAECGLAGICFSNGKTIQAIICLAIGVAFLFYAAMKNRNDQ